MVSAEGLRLDEADTGGVPWRRKSDPEYELPDTGIFDGNRYFDVVIESPGFFVDLRPWQSHLLALQ